MSPYADDLRRIRTALAAANAVLLRHAASDVPFELKPGGSPVTAADREVDDLLRGMLPATGDGWLSEESLDNSDRQACRRVWLVDPLDGTRAFVARRPEYSVSIALVVDRVPVLGAVSNPATGVCVFGGPGLGVQVEGEPVLPFSPAPPSLRWNEARLRVLASRSEWQRGEWRRQAASTCDVLPVGSVAYKLALVAGGFADATWTLQPKHEWDVAAGAALVVAAGGEVWLPSGGELRWNSEHPRFRSFAAARVGARARVEALLHSND